MKNAQEWLNKTYPTKSQKGKVRKIFIDRKERESFPNFRLFPDNSENDHYLAEKLEKKLDLSDFSRFTKLNSLYLGTDDEKRINRNIYGLFFGSLEDLKNLTVLAELD